MGEFIRHTACLNPECNSSDGMAIYSNGSGHCFVCKKNYYPDQKDYKKHKGNKVQDLVQQVKKEKDNITKEDQDEIKSCTTFEANNYRGISDEILKFYGCRTQLNDDGEVLKRYYPYTVNGELSGYKIRKHPKQFSTVGNVGTKVDLYGSFRFQSGGKYVLITGGECLLPTTKVLTKNGWVTLEEWNGQDVMTGTGDFEKPFAKVYKDYEGDLCLYKSKGYKLTMTPGHNMLRWDYRKEKLIKVKANDKTKKHLNIPLSVTIPSNFTAEEELNIRIQVMISADFTLNRDGALRASIKKPRKLNRIKNLLDKRGVRYVINPMPSKLDYFTVYIHKGHNLDVSKLFSYEKHLKYASIILDEIVHWDGNYIKNSSAIEFSSKEIHNAEFIQTCAHLNNCSSSLRLRKNTFGEWYALRISFTKNSCGMQRSYETLHYNGKVACLSTPSGTLLVKEGNSISLTGNCDTHAAFQMLKKYSDSKGSSFVTAVVSPSTGETSAAKQIAHNYEFLNKFENIIIGFDADEAGREGTESIISSLPKGKVKIASWTKAKDPNEYLENNLEKQFIADFYNAKTYVPAGVLGSDKLYDKILEQSGQKKLAFPNFMPELNSLLSGGVALGNIINLAAGTSIGKTTLVNEIVYYWIFNSPYKIGIVSMEADAGQYGEALLSRHISRKIALIHSEEERFKVLSSESVKIAANELFNENDNPRFYLVDDRDGSIKQLKDTIEQMVISSNCKVIVIDPLQDLFAGLSNEEQELFMAWCKSMVKSHKITFILINHVRKAPGGTKDSADGARLSESDIHGTSTIIKSSSVNILLSRNKMSEDEIERNTTYVEVSKNRQCGLTGPAGELYYDNETHTLWNKKEYFETVNKVPTKEF